MMPPPQASLVFPGMSGFSGVHPATTTSPPAWPAGWLAPGSDAVPLPPHAVATTAIDVTAASAIPRVLPRIPMSSSYVGHGGRVSPLTWGNVEAPHGTKQF